MVLWQLGKLQAGELAALVGVEDIWLDREEIFTVCVTGM
jgi:hypothetical protein